MRSVTQQGVLFARRTRDLFLRPDPGRRVAQSVADLDTTADEMYQKGPVPIRIPHPFRLAIGYQAGLKSYGMPTQQDGGPGSGAIIARPVPRHPTRGLRGVSGAYASAGGAQPSNASRARIPSVFVPTSLQVPGGR